MTKEYRIGIAPPETVFEHILDRVLRWLIIPTVVVLGLIIIVMVWAGIIITVMSFISTPSHAHSWYSEKHDPVTNKGCCGGSDCHELFIRPENYTPEADGFRIRLTTEQAKVINPYRMEPLDIFVPFSRVQPSEDGNFHLCIPRYNGATQGDFYCFFMPGSN